MMNRSAKEKQMFSFAKRRLKNIEDAVNQAHANQ
tara:strand:+ start:238 stop:339 length:102 start_codon:yes stop_codon:yes gene_type:complete